jgi:hypothetical protein
LSHNEKNKKSPPEKAGWFEWLDLLGLVERHCEGVFPEAIPVIVKRRLLRQEVRPPRNDG